jgi:hypothetical protein
VTANESSRSGDEYQIAVVERHEKSLSILHSAAKPQKCRRAAPRLAFRTSIDARCPAFQHSLTHWESQLRSN